jgi:drug/metabolite transporter (DMT)-like permease
LLRVGIAFALGVAGISFAAIFVRLALPAPPVIIAFYRLLIGSLLLTVWAKLAGHVWPRGRPLALVLLAGACFATDHALWNSAIVRTSVTNATLLINTTPFYVGLFVLFVLRERLAPSFVLAALLALAGTALLLGVDGAEAGRVEGDLLALAGAIFYAGYLLLMKEVRRETAVVPALLAMSWGATLALGLSALALDLPFRGFPASSWAAIAGAGVVSQVGGVLGIVWALRWLRTSFASVALLAQPVGTALLGWWILAEPIGPLQAVGGLAVLAGIFLASQEARDTGSAAPEPG